MVVKVDCTPMPTEAQRQMSQKGIESVAYGTRSMPDWHLEAVVAVAVVAASVGGNSLPPR